MFEEAKDFNATVGEFIQLFEGLAPHKTLYVELIPHYEAGFREGYETTKKGIAYSLNKKPNKNNYSDFYHRIKGKSENDYEDSQLDRDVYTPKSNPNNKEFTVMIIGKFEIVPASFPSDRDVLNRHDHTQIAEYLGYCFGVLFALLDLGISRKEFEVDDNSSSEIVESVKKFVLRLENYKNNLNFKPIQRRLGRIAKPLYSRDKKILYKRIADVFK